MNRILACLAILTFSLNTIGQQPAPPRYLIFLHNKWVEGHPPSEKHPTYGRPEYPEILDSTLQNITLHGRVLCITEASDTGNINLSAQSRFKRSKLKDFKEIILHTSLHHGFLFKAMDAWIVPTENWARFRS
jgi:hypothetical protein